MRAKTRRGRLYDLETIVILWRIGSAEIVAQKSTSDIAPYCGCHARPAEGRFSATRVYEVPGTQRHLSRSPRSLQTNYRKVVNDFPCQTVDTSLNRGGRGGAAKGMEKRDYRSTGLESVESRFTPSRIRVVL